MVVRMDFGRMVEQIDIQNRPDGVAGSRGQAGGEFTTVETVMASVEQVSATERQSGREIAVNVTHEVRMHWTANLTEQSLLKWGTRTFGVASFENVENRNRLLIIQAQEVK